MLQHPIQVVSRLTGLTPHVIRIWEKRYGAVTPSRTDSNRRLYSDEELERLRLLARATAAGHKIGIIAKLDQQDLRRLVESLGDLGQEVPPNPAPAGRSITRESGSSDTQARSGEPSDDLSEQLVAKALEAAADFHSEGLHAALEQAAVRFGHNGMLHRVICPLAHVLGDAWMEGTITAAHEHFATAAIRDFLTRNVRPFAPAENSPKVIVATPAGQLHELGAVLVSALAGNLGWRAIHLGASLPAAEIAGAAIQNRARAVLLSIIYPSDDRHLPDELRQLRRNLPADIRIVVGGRSAAAYQSILHEIGAELLGGLRELGDLLNSLRPADEASARAHRH